MKVVIIDSGVNKEFNQFSDGGYCISYRNNKIYFNSNIIDEGLHGTMCAAVIKKIEPKVEIFHIKIVDNQGSTSSELLLEALKSLVIKDCKIINLSLSTANRNVSNELSNICSILEKQGKIIVASDFNYKKEDAYPACLEPVIGVTGNGCIRNRIIYNNNKYECFVNTEPEVIKLNQYSNTFFIGKSKATAIVSGLCAKIAMENNKISKKEIIELLRYKPIIYEKAFYTHTFKIKKYLEDLYGDDVYNKLYTRCKSNYSECIKVINVIEKKYPVHDRIYFSDFASSEHIKYLFEHRWSERDEKE